MSVAHRIPIEVPPVAASSRGGPAEAVLGAGLLARLGTLAAGRLRAGPCALVTDAAVARTPHASAADASLRAAGFRPFAVELSEGEAGKSLAQAERVWAAFAENGLDRGGVVFALGGGAVGDAAGFCAALWMRGTPVVQVPTTLLAMADSAIGGKTAVNLPGGKNLVGVVHQPALVVADMDTLATLPDREFLSGFAEIVKCAVLADRARLASLRQDAPRLAARETAPLVDAVAFAVATKMDHVRGDPHDTVGLRALLNLGHTTAHAIEAESGYGATLHGEAVAAGLVVAARLAARRGVCDEGLAGEIAATLAAFGLPTSVAPELDRAALVARTRLDKKRDAGRRRMVLPLGDRGAALAEVSDAELRAALG